MMLIIGAYLAGLFLLLREAIPWLEAQRSGVIRSRGHRRDRVERAVDPDRFRVLSQQRFKAMGLGAICLAVAVGWTFWSLLNALVNAAA